MNNIMPVSRGLLISECNDECLADKFLNRIKSKNLNTYKSYEYSLREFFKFVYNINSLNEINLNHVVKINYSHCLSYISYLKDKRNLSYSTINSRVSALSKFYKFIMKYNNNNDDIIIIKHNPFENLSDDKPVKEFEETKYMSLELMRKLINSINKDKSINDLRNKAIFSLAFTTAIRKSDLLDIKVGDIKQLNGKWFFESIIKGNKKHIYLIQAQVKVLIDEYMYKSNRDYNLDKNSFLFISHSNNSKNSRMNDSSLNIILKKSLEDAGIKERFKFHSTRHSAIMELVVQNENPYKIKDFAGHASFTSTDRYVKKLPNLKNNPGEKIDIFSK